MRKLKVVGYVIWALGVATVIALVGAQGADSVLGAIAAVGWGIVLVSAAQAIPMLLDATAWRFLLPKPDRVPIRRLFQIRWIGESVNNLLPVATVAGEFLRAWLLKGKSGLPGTLAGASVIVDMTIGMAGQVLFTLVGIGLLMGFEGHGDLVNAAIAGTGLLSVGLLGFYFTQQSGLFAFSSKMIVSVARQEGWNSLVGNARQLEGVIRRIYSQRGAMLAALAWRCSGWLSGTIEVWLGFYFLGHPVTFEQALMVESLIRAVRSAAFMVPGALGIQEGGLIFLGGVVGASPEIALALAMLKRVRELAWGIPGLLIWQFSHLHRLWVKRAEVDEEKAPNEKATDEKVPLESRESIG